jgi:hypothetical protein
MIIYRHVINLALHDRRLGLSLNFQYNIRKEFSCRVLTCNQLKSYPLTSLVQISLVININMLWLYSE